MAETIALTITDVGLAAAVRRAEMKLELQLTHAALGRGAYEPDPSYRALQQIVEVVPVTATTSQNGAPTNAIAGAATFPARQASYQACELGLYAGHPDQGGVLVMLYSSPTPMVVRGAFDFDLSFAYRLAGMPAGAVTIQINPDAPLALQELGRHVNDPDAHWQLARKADLAVQAYSSGETQGSAGDYTLQVAVPPRQAKFARVQAIIHETHLGGEATLAVGSLAPAGIKLYDANGARVDVGRGRMVAGMLAEFEHDGNFWLLMNPIPAHAMTMLRAQDVLITPTPTGGDGSEMDPFIVPDAASLPGATGVSVATVRVSGLRPGEFVLAADVGDSVNGARFTPGSVTQRVANGQGVVTLPITFTDAPGSAAGTRYTMDVAINNIRVRHRRSIASAAVVSTPSITAPRTGTLNLGNKPAFTCTPYAVTGGTAAFASADWQVSLSSSFDVLVMQVNVTATATGWTPATALPYGRDYFVRMRHNGAGNLQSAWSQPVMFSVHAAPAVSKPRIVDPTFGVTGVAIRPRFSSSAFATTNAVGVHTMSDWQVSTSPTDWLAPAAQVTGSATDLVAWTPASALGYTTDYYVRMRQRDGALGYSEWSDPVKFTTGAVTPVIATPSILSPASAATGFAGPFTTSPFRMTSGSDEHVSSDIQIGTTSTFGTIVASIEGDTTNKVSWPLKTLPRGTYFVRVRHNGRAAGSSAWSAPVQFTWVLTQKPSITSPANNATNADQGLALTSSAFASSGTDRHVWTDWQVSTAADFSGTPAASVSASTTDLVRWTPSGLKPLTTYYARCRHHGDAGGPSDWSATITFRTAASSGIVWAPRSAGVAGVLRDVAYGGAKLVVVGSSTLGSNGMGAIMVSADGGVTFGAPIEWLSGVRIGAPYAVIYAGTRWIAAGYDLDGSLIRGASYVSTDGAVTWKQYAAGRGAMRDLAWNGTLVAGVGLDDNLDPIIKTSSDGGLTWVDGVDLRQIAGPLLTLEWAAELGLWIAAGITTANSESAGVILTSPDLKVWSQASIPAGVGAVMKVRWNGKMGVAVGMSSAASPTAGVILTTTDGRTWVRRTVDCGALFGVEWALSKWVAVGYTKQGLDSAGEAWTSPDGQSWTARATGSGRLTAVAQVSAPGQAGPVAAVGFTPAGTTTAGGVYVS